MISRGDAGNAAGLSTRTLDRAISDGAIRIVKVGRRVLIPRDELRRWLLAYLDVA